MNLRSPARSRWIGSRARILAAVATLALSAGGKSQAVVIGVDLGPSPKLAAKANLSFDGLNGIALNGQSLSLDFVFTNNEFVRLFTVTSPSFVSLLSLQTNGSGVVGFLDGTAYLFDQQGNVLDTPQALGSAAGNDGSMDAGFFPLVSGGLQRPVDFFGIHFDLTLPTNASVLTTGGELKLMSDSGRVFGIGPGVPVDVVPDSGSTLLLLGAASIALIGTRIRVASSV